MTNRSSIDGYAKEFFAKRKTDLSFITRFHWKSASHLKEAVRLLVSSRAEPSARNQACERQGVLDYSEYRQIRRIIASNPNTPPSVLDYLARSTSQDEAVLERIAGNPQTSDYTLVFLAHSKFSPVRAAVAENINATPDMLTVLGADPDDDVRYSLAENPHLPLDFLAGLTEDANPYVCHRAACTLSRIDCGEIVQGVFVSKNSATTKSGDQIAEG